MIRGIEDIALFAAFVSVGLVLGSAGRQQYPADEQRAKDLDNKYRIFELGAKPYKSFADLVYLDKEDVESAKTGAQKIKLAKALQEDVKVVARAYEAEGHFLLLDGSDDYTLAQKFIQPKTQEALEEAGIELEPVQPQSCSVAYEPDLGHTYMPKYYWGGPNIVWTVEGGLTPTGVGKVTVPLAAAPQTMSQIEGVDLRSYADPYSPIINDFDASCSAKLAFAERTWGQSYNLVF